MDPYSIKNHTGGYNMILVGIDVAKDKHDCCIINSDGKFPEEGILYPK